MNLDEWPQAEVSVPWAVVGGEGEVVQHVEGGHHQGQPQLHQPSVEDHLAVGLQVSCQWRALVDAFYRTDYMLMQIGG